MKRVIKNSFLLLALLGVMFTSCQKNYPEPPIQVLPVGTVYTIEDILNLEPGTVFTEDASVYGIITADEHSGNLYKAAFMQDRATGAAIELYLNATSGVRIGDSIRVYLKDVTYSVYNNLPQLSNFEADGHIIILANNRPIEPEVTTIANVNAGKHLAKLIKLENVRFTEQNTFAELNTYGNRTLADPMDYSQTVIVRTSNYANFANDSLPQGTGSLVAIASVYGNTWQLMIRSISELDFEGHNPGGGGLPYYQDFASSFGTYSTYDVLGPQSWMIDYNTAKMTGYENSTNYANQDWLISAQFSLEGITQAYMTMTYIARYFDDLDNDITVLASSDYTSGDPNAANWTRLPASWVSGSNWSDFASTSLDLSQFAGQKICVAVKYVSTDVKAGTIEVQSILIQEGAVPGPDDPPTPGTGSGTGTADDPYNVAAGIALQSDKPTAWVHGYIVGAVKNGLSTVTGNADVNWTAPFDSYTNVVIADSPTENNISNCIIVNLPAGKPLRAQVNLYDNPGNLGKSLAVLGKLRTYFGQAGLRDSEGTESDFVLEGGVTPPQPGTTLFSESFSSGQGDFTIQDVVLPPEITYVWNHDSNYSCMKASAYVSGQNYATESWLISPAIALTGVTAAKLSFNQAVNYGNPIGALSVLISTNYDGNVNTATWNTLSLNEWPSGSNWTFISSNADLTSYVGQNVTIAFKYTSTNTGSATWEIKDFKVTD